MTWKYARKRPVVIEYRDAEDGERVETREGVLTAQLGDFIIRGVQGELYPIARDIFEQTYDTVDSDAVEASEFDAEYGPGSAWREAHDGFLAVEEELQDERQRSRVLTELLQEWAAQYPDTCSWHADGEFAQECLLCRTERVLEEDNPNVLTEIDRLRQRAEEAEGLVAELRGHIDDLRAIINEAS